MKGQQFILTKTCFLILGLPFLLVLSWSAPLFRSSQSFWFIDMGSSTYCHCRSRDHICEKTGSAVGICLCDSLVLLHPTLFISCQPDRAMEWLLRNSWSDSLEMISYKREHYPSRYRIHSKVETGKLWFKGQIWLAAVLQTKVYWNTTTLIIYMSMASFMIHWQSWVVVSETVWSIKLKIFTV